jgi:hypothetical protein
MGITYGFDADGVRQIVDTVKTVKRGNLDGTAADKFRRTPNDQWFWGKTVTDSFTNNRYSVTRENVTNTSSVATDLVTWADSTGDYAATITATNTAEEVTGSHLLPLGSIVRVWWEHDIGTTNTIRYTIQETPVGMFPVKITVAGGIAGSMSAGTTCSFTYNLTDVFGNSLASGLTPVTPRYSNCQYNTPSAASPGIAYYDGGVKLYSVAQERPTGSIVTNIVDYQVVDASQKIQVKTQSQLVLDSATISGWTDKYTGSTC